MRARGLSWTFAGVFLAVLVVATVVQLAISLAVLRPLAQQHRRERAELAAERAARDLEALGAGARPFEIAETLRGDASEEPGSFLVYSGDDGLVIPDRRVQLGLHQHMVRVLARAGLADSTRSRRGPPPAGLGPPGGPMPRRDAGPPPLDEGPRPPGGPRPAPGPPEAVIDGPGGDGRPPRLELIARREVTVGGDRLGVVAVLGANRGVDFWREPEARAILLFLPGAVLAAALAGLLMVRILVRRLDALEQVTRRVAAGELDARIETSGDDEIGRLEQRFNLMTERLAAARAGLERNDQQRRQLLADITHELATPLTSVRGYLETLLDPNVPKSPDEHAVYLRDALEETERLDQMIGELFDLARLEAGAQPLARVRLDWEALVRNAMRRFEPRFAECGVTLAWEGGVGEAWVSADGRRMEQVIDNLLGNALRYVPRGGHVTCGLTRVEDGRFALRVADDGPGIRPSDLPHVFERFYRADSGRAPGGTGLGLAIVREIVTQHGGAARAEARAPRGVVFVITLPAA